MSASPSIPPSGPNSVTPTGTSAPAPRKRPAVNIFAQKKKPVKKAPAVQTTPASGQIPNGAPAQQTQRTANAGSSAAQADEGGYADYPIYVSKDTLMEGLHFHAMRLQTRPDANGTPIKVNPYELADFMRPLRLHRRNARDKKDTAEMSDAASGVDDKERELMSIKRAERQAEREANQALIAPSGGDSKKPVKKKPQKKVEDVYYDENNPVQRQRAKLRYEEARPWHLEDFEGKNVWVGSYEEPMSDTCVMFEMGDEGGFRMIPIEKWYRFTQTNRFEVMTSEEVEKHMAKKVKIPRFALGTQKANEEASRKAAIQREQERVQNRRYEDDDVKMEGEDYQADKDEIDFEFNDEFQDDDEGFVFGEVEDEDTKEIEKKIRDERRNANLAGTGVKDEDRDYDEEEQREKRAEQEEKRRTKRLRKQLIRKERKNEYDSESSHGEFSESSDSEDSEEERERLEEERKQEEAKKLNGDKSGASTKGTNTPTGRIEKRDTSKSLGASLKRPGSPDLSELSGNESSRKRVKSVNGRAVSTSAPNGARSLSPDAVKLTRTGTGGYGSGSDTDTSRTGRTKLRLKNSPTGTPSAPGSRAQSPQRKAATTFPTLEEIKAAIPPDGVDIKELAAMFKSRVLNRQPEFITLVKQAGKQDTATRKVMRKPPTGPSTGGP